jgi:NAD/NADP transhydrogenase beta subunit
VLEPERWTRGAWIFRDETLERLEILLDEAFRIPGTGIRFGIDGIIGLVPGLGDVLAGLLSLIIPLAAWIRGVPYVTLARMALNIGIGVLIGSIPFFGDVFDIAWKSNRRNYQLLRRHLIEPRRHTWRDWMFLALIAAALGVIFAIPVVLVMWLLGWLIRH